MPARLLLLLALVPICAAIDTPPEFKQSLDQIQQAMNTQKPDPGKAAGSEKTELGKGLEMLLEAMTSKIKAHNEQLTNDKDGLEALQKRMQDNLAKSLNKGKKSGGKKSAEQCQSDVECKASEQLSKMREEMRSQTQDSLEEMVNKELSASIEKKLAEQLATREQMASQ